MEPEGGDQKWDEMKQQVEVYIFIKKWLECHDMVTIRAYFLTKCVNKYLINILNDKWNIAI